MEASTNMDITNFLIFFGHNLSATNFIQSGIKQNPKLNKLFKILSIILPFQFSSYRCQTTAHIQLEGL
jgi:hypothetical protein